MKYRDGQVIKLGDRVGLGKDNDGLVVALIGTEEYSEDFPKTEWEYRRIGVIVTFPTFGTIHYKEIEADLRLISRATK